MHLKMEKKMENCEQVIMKIIGFKSIQSSVLSGSTFGVSER